TFLIESVDAGEIEFRERSRSPASGAHALGEIRDREFVELERRHFGALLRSGASSPFGRFLSGVASRQTGGRCAEKRAAIHSEYSRTLIIRSKRHLQAELNDSHRSSQT